MISRAGLSKLRRANRAMYDAIENVVNAGRLGTGAKEYLELLLLAVAMVKRGGEFHEPTTPTYWW